MSAAPALDVSNPSSANALGGELATTTLSLTQRLALARPIADIAALTQAAADRDTLGDALKTIEGFFKPLKQMADKLHAAICDREKAIKAPVLALDAQIKSAMTAFKAAEDARRHEEERARAEQQRRDDQARAAVEAAALETAGETQLAESVLAEAIAAPLPVVVLADPVKAVVTFRRKWKWRYTVDAARATELLPRAYLTVDEKKLNAYAEAYKSSAALPGVHVFYEDIPIR